MTLNSARPVSHRFDGYGEGHYALRDQAVSFGLVHSSALGHGDARSILATLLGLSAPKFAGGGAPRCGLDRHVGGNTKTHGCYKDILGSCLSQCYTKTKTDISIAAVVALGSPSCIEEARVSTSIADRESRVAG